MPTHPISVSVVIPLFNEENTVAELHRRLLGVLKGFVATFEIILVDDGSRDNTFAEVLKLKPAIILRMRRNYGQSAALAAGISRASGGIIVTIDGDLENHPEDISTVVAKLNEGYDIVSGWRKNRWAHQFLFRRLPSIIANRLISAASGLHVHDFGCTLKAYRKEVCDLAALRGERHRLIVAHAAMAGAKIGEVDVAYTPRQFGKSKYGPMRVFKVLLDVLSLVFFHRYARRPIHFFGAAGFFSLFIGILSFIAMIYFKLFLSISFISTPLPTLVAIFFIVGVQFILMGLLAEIFIQAKSESDTSAFIRDEIVNSV